ncbi:MAG: hypothetical protein PHE78_05475 [Candidatus Gastranaerophilales bacterium]|jgi:preprotein translocase subunit SecG|nr:hypothetical protein [Candidatus Gastranaerophilales bacterium]
MHNVDFWKKFLLRCFVVGLALMWLLFIVWYLVRDYSFALAHDLFGIHQMYYNKLVIDFFAVSKYILFYVFLVPSLALYWMSHKYKSEWKKNIKLDD